MCVCNVIDGFYKIVTQEKFKEYILAVICCVMSVVWHKAGIRINAW